MTDQRLLSLCDRVEHLLPNLEHDGHLTIVRLLRELIEGARDKATNPTN